MATTTSGRPGGRPGKYTQDRVRRIIMAIREGNTHKTAAAIGGIGTTTFENWQNRYPSFRDEVVKADAEAERRHVANIARAAKIGQWTASAWWLERRRREDWGRHDQLDFKYLLEREKEKVRKDAAERGLDPELAVAEFERIIAEGPLRR